MPHIDELLGAATIVSAGMFAALSLQPTDGAKAQANAVGARAPVAIGASAPTDAPIVCVSIKTVARRSASAMRDVPKQPSARVCAPNRAQQPGA